MSVEASALNSLVLSLASCLVQCHPHHESQTLYDEGSLLDPLDLETSLP